MGHVELAHLDYYLPDGSPLFSDVSFRAGEGVVVALVGAAGAGRTTLLRLMAGELRPHSGTVSVSGGLGVLPRFAGPIGEVKGDGDPSVRDLLAGLAPARIRAAARAVDEAELAMMAQDDAPARSSYAQALSAWREAGGYAYEALWDVCTKAVLGVPLERAQWRAVRTLSGGERQRLLLEALLRGPDEVLLLDEPDAFLDPPGRRRLAERLRETAKTVVFAARDPELATGAADRVVEVDPGPSGSRVHPAAG
jgi:ATPase subunit of ABC transporter with duplicated ATPase domains